MKKYAFLLLTGALVWLLWPEYGSGYSEEQRRLWNEWRPVNPVLWRQKMEPILENLPLIKRILSSKYPGEEERDGKLLANRERYSPDYDAAEPYSPDVSRLPLAGLTEKEVAERALAGDGDACLDMVGYLYLDGGIFSEWNLRNMDEALRWLERAIVLKRPGAEFLKNCFLQERENKGSQSSEEKPRVPIDRIPGYADYVKCLKKGDYPLFKTWNTLLSVPRYSSLPIYDWAEGERLLYEALSVEAKRGKVWAQRDLALLFFEFKMDKGGWNLNGMIEEDIKEEYRKWQNFLKALPDRWEGKVMDCLLFFGVVSEDRTPTMKRFHEASRYAHEAARQGDMTGMYWWLQQGMRSLKQYSAGDWQEIFAYDRVLFEAGYAPYVASLDEKAWNYSLSHEILRSFYSEKSYTSVLRKDYTAFRGRVDAWPREEIISKNDLEETRRKIGILRLVGRTDLLLENLTGVEFDSKSLLEGASEEVRGYLLELVEKWAEEGDLLAVYTLAVICEKGIGRSVDLGRADFLYNRAYSETKNYPVNVRVKVSGIDSSGEKCIALTNGSMRTSVILRWALMVLEYPDFPGRDVRAVYDRLLEASGDSQFGYRCYSVLGLFHERGIGVPVDRKKALDFYKNGQVEEDNCQEHVKRLSSILSSGQQ